MSNINKLSGNFTLPIYSSSSQPSNRKMEEKSGNTILEEPSLQAEELNKPSINFVRGELSNVAKSGWFAVREYKNGGESAVLKLKESLLKIVDSVQAKIFDRIRDAENQIKKAKMDMENDKSLNTNKKREESKQQKTIIQYNKYISEYKNKLKEVKRIYELEDRRKEFLLKQHKNANRQSHFISGAKNYTRGHNSQEYFQKRI